MSTGKNDKVARKSGYLGRFAQLAGLGMVIFHAGDLANLWQIKNKNTLHTTLKRYTRAGLLTRVYRGLYSLKPVEKLEPALLGAKALHRYAYMSAETVLAQEGIIQQKINRITLVSSVSKKFSINGQNFHSRKLADRFLYNPAGIIEKDGVKRAMAERAVADMLYFNPKTHFDAEGLINWRKVKEIQETIGYSPTFKHYRK
ncbi:MAG: hypothetical protein PHT16_01085 [Candidatus Pacebacteria bacterium]|nr:hypothetical protein [Candidatus Paceibacterota bacterium]